MCRQARGLHRSQTEPAKMQRQMRSPGSEAVQHGWRTVGQQCPQASKNRLVTAGKVRRGAGRQGAEQVVAPRSRTHEQQQPSRLKVRDGGDFGEEGRVDLCFGFQERVNKSVATQRCAHHHHALLFCRQRGGANPYWGAPRQRRKFRRKALRFLARSVPNPRFAEVQVYVGVLCQRSAEGTEGGNCAFAGHIMYVSSENAYKSSPGWKVEWAVCNAR